MLSELFQSGGSASFFWMRGRGVGRVLGVFGNCCQLKENL